MTDRIGRWGLRLLAVVGAAVVWWLASGEQRERISERVLDASVSYNAPSNIILLDPIQTVKVRLKGPDSRVRQISPNELDVVVNIEAGGPGTRVVLLGRADVVAPEEVEVTSVEPGSLTIRVDREATARLPVVPRIVGTAAGGAVAGPAVTRPDRAMVSGPEGIVSGLTSVTTSAISLDGHSLSFSQAVSVVSPDPLVRIVEPPFVTVQVNLIAGPPDDKEDEAQTGGAPRRADRGRGR